MASPSPGSRGTFVPPGIKVNRVGTPQQQSPLQTLTRIPNQSCIPSVVAAAARPTVGSGVRPGTFVQPPSPFSPQAPQSPHDYPQSPAPPPPPSQTPSSSQEHFQRFDNSPDVVTFNPGNQTPRSIIQGTTTYSTSPRNDTFTQPPGTPRPIFNPSIPRTSAHVYAPSRVPDPYSNQPSALSPAPSYTSPRPELRQDSQQQQTMPEVFSQQPEVNRQLRDLLQRQQLNKKIDTISGNWNQEEGQFDSSNLQTTQQQLQQQHQLQPAGNTVEGTFRHPLPPGMRPRIPIPGGVFVRNTLGKLRLINYRYILNLFLIINLL